jgi:glycosyltransferase involved in cell wall biosynthesis
MITDVRKPSTDRIKVLHVITHLGVGGALDNTLLTVERLPRDRYQVDLAAGYLPIDEKYSSWEERSRACADELYFFPELQRAVRPLRDLNACRRLSAFMRRQRYQIVHTHCAKAGVIGRIAAHRAGVPIIVHTCHAFGSQIMRGPKRSAIEAPAAAVKEHAFTLLERLAGRLSHRIVTVCEENKRQAIRQRLAAPDDIVTIYSGIDLRQFDVRIDRRRTCEVLQLDPRRPHVGFVGRLAEQKAPLDFVAAAKRVLAERPDVQFIMAGDGPLVDQVRAAIGNESSIRSIGYWRQVPELMSVLDVLAVSSLWEGLGRSVTEAMIMGIPVAATAVDGVPEIVIHERTGLLSPPGDPASLARNILRLLNHPDEAHRMAQAAKRCVVPAFGADRMIDRIDSLYRTLLRERRLIVVPALPASESLDAFREPIPANFSQDALR